MSEKRQRHTPEAEALAAVEYALDYFNETRAGREWRDAGGSEPAEVRGQPVTCHTLHRPRTLADTAAGIRREPNAPIHCHRFWVHCVECCDDYGPFDSLAAAQDAGRACPTCRRSR